jgi:hypothetical protein
MMNPGEGTKDHGRVSRELAQQLKVAQADAQASMQRASQSLSDLGSLMQRQGSSFHDLVTTHLPSITPGLVPDEESIRKAKELDELISVKNLPPIRPSSILTRIINQRL